MPKLTKRTVEGAGPKGRDYFIWDDDLPGFGLRVFASGKRSYLVQYMAAGRTRRCSIGLHGPITPAETRAKALALLAEVKSGGNPAEDRASDRGAVTVAQLAERYLAEWARRRKKPRSIEEDERNLRLHVLPVLGRRRVRDVTKQDIERLHASLSVERADDGAERPTPVRANRVRALLSKGLLQNNRVISLPSSCPALNRVSTWQTPEPAAPWQAGSSPAMTLKGKRRFGYFVTSPKAFALSEEWNLRPSGSNPCRGVKPMREAKRERYLSRALSE